MRVVPLILAVQSGLHLGRDIKRKRLGEILPGWSLANALVRPGYSAEDKPSPLSS